MPGKQFDGWPLQPLLSASVLPDAKLKARLVTLISKEPTM